MTDSAAIRRHAMEDDLDREWEPILNGGTIILQYTCPRCGAGVPSINDRFDIQRHKEWHRQLGH